MKRIPGVKSVMTPFPYSIGIDEPLDRAIEMMHQHDFRHLPVMKKGELVGVLSEPLLRQVTDRAEGSDPAATVSDIRVNEAFIVELDERLDRVVLAMAERHLDSALVVKDGRLAGIFTTTDACRYLGEILRAEFPGYNGNEVA
ncbi:MAG: CBS domain-containing protein [Acidobacteriota bacterium]|nr:CBS domain-containing protein [Acidobacteriota bacterium]